MPPTGIHSATVPGAVAGWDALLTRFGKKTFADVLAPAIAYAKEGFPVTEIFGDDWAATAGYVARNAEAARVYLPNRRLPEAGDIFRNPDLAGRWPRSPRAAVTPSTKVAIAKRILDTSARLGGTMAADDLAEFAAEWIDPVSTDYRGWTVYEMPPNEQGIAALMMLNIMEGLPARAMGPQFGRSAARDDRGEEARLCRHDHLCRRPALRRGADQGADLSRPMAARARP